MEERVPLGEQTSASLYPILQLVWCIIIIWAKKQILKRFFKLPSAPPFNPLTSGLEFIDDFFLFDPPVLEPDCDLPLREVCRGWYPPPFVLGNEFVRSVFPFEFFQLHLSVRHALLSPPPIGAGVWRMGDDVGQSGLPEVGRLRLLFGAVHLAVPAVGQSPGLIAFHGKPQRLVARLARTPEPRNYWHIQVAGHGLVMVVRPGCVALMVESKLLGAGAELLGRGAGGVHVLVGEGGGGRSRLRARLDGVGVRAHAGARVVAAAEVAVGQRRGPRRALCRRRAGTALLGGLGTRGPRRPGPSRRRRGSRGGGGSSGGGGARRLS